ncbi:MAG: gamma-glutamyltransferase [Pseudomonadota bacterium]
MVSVEPAGADTEAPIISDSNRSHPVFARSGMVVSQEAVASAIGADVLRRGGNAVDAAVATGFALAVTLPRAGNLGGGGFMLVHLAEADETIAIDYRETAPAATTRDVFLDEDGEADPNLSRFTGLGIGVPGTVAGLTYAHQTYGSGTFTLLQLVEPAFRLALDGIVVSQDLSRSLDRARERLIQYPATAEIFFPDGETPQPGDRLKQTDLARTLLRIGERGSEAFYAGDVADQIAASVQEAGGRMTVDDLAAYNIVERAPVTGSYRGHEIQSMPPPSSGGIHLIQILNTLEGFDLAASGFGSAQTMHLMAEAMKRAYADRSEYLGDPDFVDVPITRLTSKAYASDIASSIHLYSATPSAEIAPGDLAPYESEETTHVSVVDRDGNAVSNTYTLNFSYGVGLVAAGTGVLLNNELDDFAAQPGVPNAYGLVGGEANAPEPNKRPLSSMSPTLVFDPDGELLLVTGSPGGSRIITTVLQVISNVIDHDMNVQDASAAPRMHHQWLPDVLFIEPGFSPDTLRLLGHRGHVVEERRTTGSTQSIRITEDGWLAGASDPRRPGAGAVGVE